MAFEKLDWVETPDEATPFDFTSILAVLGSSIENNVGSAIYHAEGTVAITDSVNFQPYTQGNVLRVTRDGKYVTLSGTWGVKTAGYIEGLNSRIFGQIPVGFRPKYHFYQIMQGSGTTSFLLNIGADGKVSVSRASGTQIANYWMPINVNFLAED